MATAHRQTPTTIRRIGRPSPDPDTQQLVAAWLSVLRQLVATPPPVKPAAERKAA